MIRGKHKLPNLNMTFLAGESWRFHTSEPAVPGLSVDWLTSDYCSFTSTRGQSPAAWALLEKAAAQVKAFVYEAQLGDAHTEGSGNTAALL